MLSQSFRSYLSFGSRWRASKGGLCPFLGTSLKSHVQWSPTQSRLVNFHSPNVRAFSSESHYGRNFGSVSKVSNLDPPNLETYYGCNVMDRRTMKKYLTPEDYLQYQDCISNNKPMMMSTADAIASAMLRWATDKGATHFTHWFQPILGQTAEKHDTLLDTKIDGETPISRFGGKHLILGEPDGSSFPSGGLRGTHFARGYTAWDPHSPPFILSHSNGATLYVPSMFFSWEKSQALDEKIPLLRSEAALRRETMKLFEILEEKGHSNVHMDSGLEQEFFLINRSYYMSRPDLVTTGRTVIGASPPKGQELEDQYFAHSSNKVLDCLHEFEVECWKLGIPIQTRHREVAPGQYEVAPKFAPSNVGIDRNLIMMELLKKTARKHELAALLHEKPFKGVNGSGKHNNWSLGSDQQPSLLTPGPRPEENPYFMLFLAATIRAINQHGDLMRVAISGCGNDHRLGANEAPPAIVSVYLGDDIELAVDRFITGNNSPSLFDSRIHLGVPSLPDLHRVSTDRNRTSTFAFTGNKFEFRAVGSSQNPSRSNQVLNTIVADSVRWMGKEIESLRNKGMSTKDALKKVTQTTLKESKRIIFNGNGYSEEWQKEAEKRGLPNLKTTPQALDTLCSEKNVTLFESLNVLSKAELEARSAILYHEYCNKIIIEAKVMCTMVQTGVVPTAVSYQRTLGEAVERTERLGEDCQTQKTLLKNVTSHLSNVLAGVELLKSKITCVHHESTSSGCAHFAEKNIIPIMNKIRESSDALESVMPSGNWPFPTYHQMLFHQD